MPHKKNRVTISQVAEYAQVSTMTVSRVVNNRGQVSEQTRQLVRNAMDQLGYKPNRIARSLVSNKTYKIGVIVPDLGSSFFASILSSIEHVLWKHHYYMVLSNSGKSNRREQDILNGFEEEQVDGVLVFGSYLNAHQLTSLLKNQRAAVVFNGESDSKVAGQILLNHHSALEIAVNHLYLHQRQYLAYIGLNQSTYATRERKRCFEEVTKQLNIQHWVMNATLDDINPNLPGYLEMYPQTDGLICFNDEFAAECLLTLSKIGKHVPDDIAVIGFDDIRLAQLVTPRLTTIRLKKSIRELGELAANMLLERIEGDRSHTPIILDHELVIRDSTP